MATNWSAVYSGKRAADARMEVERLECHVCHGLQSDCVCGEMALEYIDRLETANRRRNLNVKRFCELLEAIDARCIAADGPVTPTLAEATADELRRLYLFADYIRKEG